ncbi:MAG: LysM peptidoglycan-binding domain-containing protein [candidate division Zixibacteria bacterium]|nr:LysM peptidoglycan-binding domain-containing protein [candidate division Zixibacteria bacterium]
MSFNKSFNLTLSIACLLITVFLFSGCQSVNPSQQPTLLKDKPKLREVITEEPIVTSDQDLELEYSLDMAEYYYALGVNANREGDWEVAQNNFERSLEILSEIDVTADSNGTSERFNILLNEIEQDYRFTLSSLGLLSDESSHSAFLELFSDIKNFKTLRESLTAKQVAEPESVTYNMPIEFNQRVQNSLVYLQTVGGKHFGLYLARMGRYKELMLEIIRQYELPEDLIYLPLIESGFNPKAYSYARASGPWQFISSTGKTYGLKRNWWYDDRRDFVKSTHAACKYLKFLYKKFGCWKLALASYNGGEGRVGRQIKRQKTNDFWKLRLKKQTMNYVPLYMAATIIAKEPEKYGFPDVQSWDPVEFDVVTVNKVMSLKTVASKIGVDHGIIKQLNPEILRDVTPPNYPDYQLRVPPGFAEKFTEVYASIPGEKTTNWITHRVRKGEALSTIARRYGVSMSSISSANKIRRKSRIYAGQKLMIPVPDGYKKSSKSSSYTKKGKYKSVKGVYTVRKGDTLWDIASAFSVTITDLKKMNKLKGRNPKVYPGDRLRVFTGTPSTGNGLTHVVRKGDTLWSIAKRYKTTVSNIRQWNNLSLSKLILPGEKLKIYSSN